MPVSRPERSGLSQIRQLQVLVYSPSRPMGHAPTAGTLEQVCWSDSERRVRALRRLGLFWLLSLMSVALPVLHFFLVPGFLIGGVVAWFWEKGRREQFAGGQGICPCCGQGFRIASDRATLPMRDVCEHCQSELEISLQF